MRALRLLRSATAAATACIVLASCATLDPGPTPTEMAPTVVRTAAASSATPLTPASPTATPPGAGPLSAADVVARLRTVEPQIDVVAPSDYPWQTGVFPRLTFRAAGVPDGVTSSTIGFVLVYPTPAEPASSQPAFGPSEIHGPSYLYNWDGVSHSEWIGVENVLVEVLVPGGQFGGGPPTEADLAYPERIRGALAAPPSAGPLPAGPSPAAASGSPPRSS